MRKEISSPSLIQSLEKSEVYSHGQKTGEGTYRNRVGWI